MKNQISNKETVLAIIEKAIEAQNKGVGDVTIRLIGSIPYLEVRIYDGETTALKTPYEIVASNTIKLDNLDEGLNKIESVLTSGLSSLPEYQKRKEAEQERKRQAYKELHEEFGVVGLMTK